MNGSPAARVCSEMGVRRATNKPSFTAAVAPGLANFREMTFELPRTFGSAWQLKLRDIRQSLAPRGLTLRQYNTIAWSAAFEPLW